MACQAPLSMEFSWQEYWSGLPFFSPGDLPNVGMEPTFLASQTPGDLPNLGMEPRFLALQLLYCLTHQGSPKAPKFVILGF